MLHIVCWGLVFARGGFRTAPNDFIPFPKPLSPVSMAQLGLDDIFVLLEDQVWEYKPQLAPPPMFVSGSCSRYLKLNKIKMLIQPGPPECGRSVADVAPLMDSSPWERLLLSQFEPHSVGHGWSTFSLKWISFCSVGFWYGRWPLANWLGSLSRFTGGSSLRARAWYGRRLWKLQRKR